MKIFITFLFIFINLKSIHVKCEYELNNFLFDNNTLINELKTYLRIFAKSHRQKREVDFSDLSQETLCFGCEAVVSTSKVFIKSESLFRSLFKHVCSTLKFEEGFVCESLSKFFSPHIRYILLNTHLTAKEICEISLYRCSSEIKYRNDFWKVPNLKIDQYLSPSLGQKHLKEKNLTALWVTDIHLDPFYEKGSCTLCKEPLCCRSTSQPLKDEYKKAGKWGSIAKCDLPMLAVENFFEYAEKNIKDHIDYIIFTGDVSPHFIWAETKEDIVNNSKVLAEMFKTYLPKKDIIIAVGNHESSPVNLFPPPSIHNELSINWLYEELYNLYKEWIPEESSSYFKHGGYYYKDVGPKLRLIIINTNFCARLNFWLWYDSEDPGDQLKWLLQQLKIAKMKSKKVHIIGHIPPDYYNCEAVWLHNYMKILEYFKDTIVGQFFGHTHFDEFRVYYSEKSELIGSALIGGSLTTFEEVNPIYKIVKIDTDGILSDIITYSADINQANSMNETSLLWNKEYSTKTDYNMESVNNKNMDLLYQRLGSDSKFFDMFYKFYHRSSPSPIWNHTCSDECRNGYLNSFKVCDSIVKFC